MTPLRQRITLDMQVRNLAARTQTCTVDCVAKYAQFHGRCPSQLGRSEVRDYLAHLAHQRHASPTTLRQTISALRFMYRVTLDRAAVVADIDRERMLIRVRQGKGGRDRLVCLSARLLAELDHYHAAARPTDWLFVGARPGQPASRPNFFLPVRVASRVFRGKFIAHLRRAYHQGRLVFPGQLGWLATPAAFSAWLAELAAKEWVVYAKPPFGGPEQVLRYLARYTHRVAITNQRLLSLDDGRVRFRWKDYAHASRWKTMSLSAGEFIRRLLLHVLPKGFVRIRYFGFLANRVRSASLALCRALLGMRREEQDAQGHGADPAEPGPAPAQHVCPACGRGRLVVVEVLLRQPNPLRIPILAPAFNTS